MKTRFVHLLAALALPLLALGCDVEKTQEGEAPEIETRGGQAPEFDVDAPEVETHREPGGAPDIDISGPREGTETPRD